MGCALCRRRQVDPARGPSDWRRGVMLADGRARQVLVCPDCTRDPSWTEALARCDRCGSTALLIRLGEVSCRQCGGTDAVPGPRAVAGSDLSDPEASLREDVAAALDRVLGRG